MRRRMALLALGVTLGLLLASTQAAYAAFTITRSDLNNGQLRLEGQGAPPNQSVFADGLGVGNTDAFGFFKILFQPFSSSTCVVTVTIGIESAQAPLAGCTPTPLALLNLSLDVASVEGGPAGTVGGMVSLNQPAPAAGATVNFSSSNPAVASPQLGQATIPQGSNSFRFFVSTSQVTSSTPITITAALSGSTSSLSTTLTVLPPANQVPNPTLTRVFVNPTTVVDSAGATGTVQLSGTAPTCCVVVSLASSNPAVASVPASVTVGQFDIFASFSVTTSRVATLTAVTISASAGGATLTASLTVAPFGVSNINFGGGGLQSSVAGGTAVSSALFLNAPAPAGGAVVNLSSSNPGAASVPASVTVPAGATSAAFTTNTSPVAATTPVNITATVGFATFTAVLTVLPPPAITGLNFFPSIVTGGAATNAQVTLSYAPAPCCNVISLSSGNPAVAPVPPSLTFNANDPAAGLFSILTQPVTVETVVTITATFNGQSFSAQLTVARTPPPPAVIGLTLTPATQTGGTSSVGVVTLASPSPVAAGSTVALSSSNPAVASVPASVSVPFNSTTGTFNVATTAVTATTTVTISASSGGATQSAVLTVTPSTPTPVRHL